MGSDGGGNYQQNTLYAQQLGDKLNKSTSYEQHRRHHVRRLRRQAEDNATQAPSGTTPFVTTPKPTPAIKDPNKCKFDPAVRRYEIL